MYEAEVCENAHPIIYDGNQGKLLEIVGELVGSSSTIDSTHIREGVVVRVESEDGVNAYKLKSHTFLVLEGLVKDKDDYVDMEEAN